MLILLGQLIVLGTDPFILRGNLFILRRDLSVLYQGVRQEPSQHRYGRQRGRHDIPHGPPAGPLVQSVKGCPDDRRQDPVFFLLQFFQVVRKAFSPDVGCQRFPFFPVSVLIRLKPQQFREAVLRLPFHQYSQHPVPALMLNKVFQLPQAPFALQVTR